MVMKIGENCLSLYQPYYNNYMIGIKDIEPNDILWIDLMLKRQTYKTLTNQKQVAKSYYH